MEIYKKHAMPPKDALRTIQAGRLKGKSDISPQWRLEALTDLFGMVGIGWYTEITRREYREGANGEIAYFVEIGLYVKVDGEWSKPIVGTGGSMFVASERNGMYTSDEAEKMAYTDAISVACKAIGIASDIYRGRADSKYTAQPKPKENPVVKDGTKEFKACVEWLMKEPGNTIEKLKKHYQFDKKVEESLNAAVAAQTQKTEVL